MPQPRREPAPAAGVVGSVARAVFVSPGLLDRSDCAVVAGDHLPAGGPAARRVVGGESRVALGLLALAAIQPLMLHHTLAGLVAIVLFNNLEFNDSPRGALEGHSVSRSDSESTALTAVMETR